MKNYAPSNTQTKTSQTGTVQKTNANGGTNTNTNAAYEPSHEENDNHENMYSLQNNISQLGTRMPNMPPSTLHMEKNQTNNGDTMRTQQITFNLDQQLPKATQDEIMDLLQCQGAENINIDYIDLQELKNALHQETDMTINTYYNIGGKINGTNKHQ